MIGSWIIALAPSSKLPDEDWESFPGGLAPVPAEEVARLLEDWPLVRRQGLSFQGSRVERFTLPADGVRVVPIEGRVDSSEIARLALLLSKTLGPVTVLDIDITIRAEVTPDVEGDLLLKALAAPEERLCGRCRRAVRVGERCVYCGWDPSRPRRSLLEPHPAAPGRPERRILPPLGLVLRAVALGALLGYPALVWLGSCLSRPEPSPRGDPLLSRTQNNMVLAHFMLRGSKPPTVSSEGWIEISAGTKSPGFANPDGEFPTVTMPDGRRYLCDSWRSPIRCLRKNGTLLYRSPGPDGRFGTLDDIEQSFPEK